MLLILLVSFTYSFIGFVPESKAQQVQGGAISFSPNQIPTLTTSYQNGVWSFGSKVNVSISFLNKGIRTAISAFSRSAGAAKFAEVMVREKDRIHWGLNITNLPLGLANQLDAVQFKIETSEKIEYSSNMEPETGRNISDFSIPTLNLDFRFDDLQDAGFDLNVSSSLDIIISNVKGKTSLLLDPITYSSNTITVTGYTAVAPCSFNDLWLADKAGERLLRANVTVAQDLSLITQILPTDNVSLKPRFVVSGYASAGFINVTGTDKDGNAQTEYDIAVSGDGNYSTSLWFKTISTNGLDCNGSYGIAVYQMQWGVVWKQATNQYAFDTRVYFDDGSYFTDTDKQVIFNAAALSATGQYCINMHGNSNLILGKVENATNKITSSGCSLISNTGRSDYLVGFYGGVCYLQLYGCTFSKLDANPSYVIGGVAHDGLTNKIWNCVFYRVSPSVMTADFYNLVITKHVYYGFLLNAGTFDTITVGAIGIAATYNNIAGTSTFVNMKFRNNPLVATLQNANVFIKLVDCTADTWAFSFNHASQIVYRQYTFDLTVTYPNNTAFENANVTLYDKSSTVVFSFLTNSSGQIAAQTVSRGFYNQTGGNTMYDNAPFTLNITSSYGNYTKIFSPTEGKKWDIALIETSVTSESSFWRILGMFSIVGYLIIGAVMYVLPHKKKNENEG